MKLQEMIQIALVGGLLCVTFALFFVAIPPSNLDMFKMCIVSIISFISGVATNKGLGKEG